METNLWINTDEGVGLGVEFLLQRNDDGLEVLYGLVFDVIGHLEGTRGNYDLYTCCVKSSVMQKKTRKTDLTNRPCQC